MKDSCLQHVLAAMGHWQVILLSISKYAKKNYCTPSCLNLVRSHFSVNSFILKGNLGSIVIMVIS